MNKIILYLLKNLLFLIFYNIINNLVLHDHQHTSQLL